MWRRWYEIDLDSAPDAFVSWRNPEAALLLPRAARRYVWLQDIIDEPACGLAADQTWALEPQKPCRACSGLFH